MRSPRTGQRGFTLLEVLVASLIMAFAVGGLLSALSLSLRNASRVTDFDRATLLAKRKMDELLVDRRLPKMVPIEGRFSPVLVGGDQKDEAGWRAMVRPFEIAQGSGANVWYTEQIQLLVWWKTGAGEKQIKLEGYRRGVLTQEQVDAGWVPK